MDLITVSKEVTYHSEDGGFSEKEWSFVDARCGKG